MTHDNSAYDNLPTTLRDQIGLAVIAAHKTFDDSNGWSWADYGGHIADAVLGVLPAPLPPSHLNQHVTRFLDAAAWQIAKDINPDAGPGDWGDVRKALDRTYDDLAAEFAG